MDPPAPECVEVVGDGARDVRGGPVGGTAAHLDAQPVDVARRLERVRDMRNVEQRTGGGIGLGDGQMQVGPRRAVRGVDRCCTGEGQADETPGGGGRGDLRGDGIGVAQLDGRASPVQPQSDRSAAAGDGGDLVREGEEALLVRLAGERGIAVLDDRLRAAPVHRGELVE